MKYAGSTLVSEEEATDRAIFAASASLYAPFTLTYTSALQLDSNWTCGKYSGSMQERNITPCALFHSNRSQSLSLIPLFDSNQMTKC